MRLLIVLFLVSVLVISCEDDPIVEPQSNGNTSGGSYARLSFPDSTQLDSLNQ